VNCLGSSCGSAATAGARAARRGELGDCHQEGPTAGVHEIISCADNNYYHGVCVAHPIAFFYMLSTSFQPKEPQAETAYAACQISLQCNPTTSRRIVTSQLRELGYCFPNRFWEIFLTWTLFRVFVAAPSARLSRLRSIRRQGFFQPSAECRRRGIVRSH